ncbi:MAG: GDP-mannose 4,6-dehydratase [Solirubrobacterales bacterium]|nr:GDP-mannose 4,6-dehydratase [Solirubrobacterales bacterium]
MGYPPSVLPEPLVDTLRPVAAPRALITGIGGQDGSYLAEQLLQTGHEVVGMVRPPVDRPQPNLGAIEGRYAVVPGDLTDPASLRRAVDEVRPDLLFHLAAPTFVPDSWRDPTATIAGIAGGTGALLAAVAATVPEARVVVATSAEIFGDAGESPQNERSPMRPQSPYGVAKLAAHGLVGTMRAHHGLHLSSAITFNHESPRRPEHFLPRKVTRGVAKIVLDIEQEIVLGDLDAVRDWCDARDVVRGLRLMAGADEPGDYVLASGVSRTVRDLVDAAFGHLELSSEGRVRVNPEFVRAPEATQPLGDPTKARERLGWTPEIPFAQTIGEMVEADLAALRSASR